MHRRIRTLTLVTYRRFCGVSASIVGYLANLLLVVRTDFPARVYPLSGGGASIIVYVRVAEQSRMDTEVVFGNMQVEIVAVTILGETEAMVRRDDEIPIFWSLFF